MLFVCCIDLAKHVDELVMIAVAYICFVGNKESKQVLDAFFLGKAVAEAVSERVGSALGELLSEIGQRQAEQQRRFREFQVTSLLF